MTTSRGMMRMAWSAMDKVAARTQDPYSVRLTVERLKLFWGAVLQLLPWHRAAFVLNLRDGDLDALPYYGVASIEAIGEAIELKEKQLSTLESRGGGGVGDGVVEEGGGAVCGLLAVSAAGGQRDSGGAGGDAGAGDWVQE